VTAVLGCSSGAGRSNRDAGADAGPDGDADADADSDGDADGDADSGADGGSDSGVDGGADCDAGPGPECPGHCAAFARCECRPCEAECACDVGLLRGEYVASVSGCIEGTDCDALHDVYRNCMQEALAALEPTELAAAVIEDCEARSVECQLTCPPIAVLSDKTLGTFAHCWAEPSCDEIIACVDPIDNICD
jgi:hypothetical protein